MRDNSATYTLAGPTGAQVELAPTLTSTMWIEDCSFNSTVRTEVASRPQAHGSYMDPGFRDGGLWAAKIRMIGGAQTMRANKERLLGVLNALLGEDGGGTLQWVEQGYELPQRLAGLQLMDEQGVIDGGSYLWSVLLQSEKPFAEDAVATVVDSAPLTAGGGGFTIPLTVPFTVTASAGGTLSVTNAGTFYAYPVLRAYGPIDSPRITNLNTGQALQFTGSIGPGDYWEVDLAAKTVRLNGVTSVRTITVAASDWFRCARGVTNLQLSGLNYSTSTLLRAFMRSAWA